MANCPTTLEMKHAAPKDNKTKLEVSFEINAPSFFVLRLFLIGTAFQVFDNREMFIGVKMFIGVTSGIRWCDVYKVFFPPSDSVDCVKCLYFLLSLPTVSFLSACEIRLLFFTNFCMLCCC